MLERESKYSTLPLFRSSLNLNKKGEGLTPTYTQAHVKMPQTKSENSLLHT